MPLHTRDPSLDQIRQCVRQILPIGHYLREFEELYGQMSQPTDPQRFSMADIISFCATTGDNNVIHRPDAATPVVPGLLTVTALGKYFRDEFPFKVPDHETIISRFDGVQFFSFVAPDAPVYLQFRVVETSEQRRGSTVTCEFSVTAGAKAGSVVGGKVTFMFIGRELFARLARTALR